MNRQDMAQTAEDLRHADFLMRKVVEILIAHGQSPDMFTNITEGSCLLRGADMLECLAAGRTEESNGKG